jgi:hypothetical protein
MNAMNQMTTDAEEAALHVVESSELQAIVGGFDVTQLYDIPRPVPVWQVEFPKHPPIVPK